jgi:hypothetical protein
LQDYEWSLSYVLFIKTNQYPIGLFSYFSYDQLELIHDSLKRVLFAGEYDAICFDEDILHSIRKIIKELLMKNGDRKTATEKLLELQNVDKNSFKLIACLVSLINKLPSDEIHSRAGEINLCCNYVNPMLFHMLTEFDKKSSYNGT